MENTSSLVHPNFVYEYLYCMFHWTNFVY